MVESLEQLTMSSLLNLTSKTGEIWPRKINFFSPEDMDQIMIVESEDPVTMVS